MESESSRQFLRYRLANHVFLQREKAQQKADKYTVFVQMLQNHVHWDAMWEYLADRADRVPIGMRMATERSVKILALWICAQSSGELVEGSCKQCLMLSRV